MPACSVYLRLALWLPLLCARAIAEAVNLTAPEATPKPTATHKPTVHGEGQPSIAGYGLWIGFAVLVSLGLAFDYECNKRFVAMGKQVRGAIYTSIAWVALAFFFAFILATCYGGEVGLVFVTGYLLEESLSIDNLVVIALIFKSFHIKAADQGPVLKWGIWGAIVFRLLFIFMGVWMLEHMHSMIYLFGGILLWSAWKMYGEDDDDDDSAHDHSKGDSIMMRLLTSVIPYNAEAKGRKFVEQMNGVPHATPMLAALVVVELSDLLFAVDSIPCILGMTHDLFLVFSSNMCAILGLRSLYLLLAELMDKVKNLKTGLAIVLAFVGAKMMLGEWFPLSQTMSLFVIFSIVGGTVAKSFIDARRGQDKPKLVLPF
jgi:tellurite resistance protein TerC